MASLFRPFSRPLLVTLVAVFGLSSCERATPNPTASTPVASSSTPALAAPFPRSGAAMAFYPELGKTVLFGGRPNYGCDPPEEVLANLDATWTYDGRVWDEAQLPGPASDRFVAQTMTYQSTLHRIVLAGISVEARDLGKTSAPGRLSAWLYDGTRWQRATTDEAPSVTGARVVGAADGSGSVVYVVEGDSTWVLSRGHWRRGPEPPHVSVVGAVFDANLKKVFFIGKSKRRATFRVYQLEEGRRWTVVPVKRRPPPSEGGAAATFAPELGGTLLIGPSSFSSAGTWLFDGHDWKELRVAGGPNQRVGQIATYDSAAKQVLLFGGYWDGTKEYYGDLWALPRDLVWSVSANQPTFQVPGNTCPSASPSPSATGSVTAQVTPP